MGTNQIKVIDTIKRKINHLVVDDISKLSTEEVSVAKAKLVLVNAGEDACGNFWLNHDGETYSIHSTDEGDRQYQALIKPILISETEEIQVSDWFLADGKYIIQCKPPVSESFINGNFYRSKCNKILALPEHFAPRHLQDIVDVKLKDGDQVLIETCAGLDPSSPIPIPTIIKLNPFNHITIHK